MLRDETSFEVIVVDNGSSDGTQRGLQEFAWVTVVRFDENHNFAGGCNAGAARANGDIILFLNNDAVPIGNPFPALCDRFADPGVAIAAGTLFYEDGPIQMAGAGIQRDGAWTPLLPNAAPEFAGYAGAGDALPTGAAVAVRATWFRAAGGYDEAYRNGKEDDDLVMRARSAGMTCAVVPDARFAHYDGATVGRNEYNAQNEALFAQKWGAQLPALPRIARGRVGAMLLRDGSVGDMESRIVRALTASIAQRGHPVIRHWYPWLAVDTRFRPGAMVELRWRCSGERTPSVEVMPQHRGLARIQVRGVVDMTIPFNPCMPDGSPCRFSFDAAHGCVAIVARDAVVRARLQGALGDVGREVRVIAPDQLSAGDAVRVACVVVDGVLDTFGYANALLASNSIPCVALDDGDIASMMDDDVVPRFAFETLGAGVRALLADGQRLRDLGEDARNDASRRFTPSRSARRLIEVSQYARFGLPKALATAR